MTTVFGFRHPQVNLAVLGADMQTTIGNSQKGYYEKSLEGRKIWITDNGLYAFGHSGTYDPEMVKFTEDMKSGKIDLAAVIQKGGFEELRELNLKRLGRKKINPDSSSSFLLINRDGKTTNLYTCFPLGDVEPREWTQIGSGGDRIEKYMDALYVLGDARGYLPRKGLLSGENIIQAVAEGVRYAQTKDMYSSGIDMVVMTPEKTFDCFADLQDDFEARVKSVQDKVKQ